MKKLFLLGCAACIVQAPAHAVIGYAPSSLTEIELLLFASASASGFLVGLMYLVKDNK